MAKICKVLAVGAHPDDIEISCGGTICLLKEKGMQVDSVTITNGERGGLPVKRVTESNEGCKILGVNNTFFGNFKDTEVSCSRKLIMYLENLNSNENYDIALIPTVHDTHQDHRELSLACVTAFRKVPILIEYESPSTTSGFVPNVFFDIGNYMKTKQEAIECHETQKEKDYLEWNAMLNLSSYRGSQSGTKFAEAFSSNRFLVNTLLNFD